MISADEYIGLKRTAGTRRHFTVIFRRYFRSLGYADYRDIRRCSLEYLSLGRDFFQDVNIFLEYMLKQNNAPMTITGGVRMIVHWLGWNDIQFSPLQQSMLQSRIPRAVSVRDEDIFDIQKIKSLLAHSDVYMRALILVLVSSGMRIGEALSVTEEQIRGNEIHMRADQMKAAKPHVYFISGEALQALDEWRKVRPEALRRADHKTTKCLQKRKLERGEAIFFYSYNVSREKFVRTLENAELFEKDTNTNWSRLTFHGFRKFADSVMKAHITPNLANALIGHFEAGDSSYRRYTLEQLRAAYAEVEPYLTIQAPPDYAENKNETRQQLASHDKLLVALVEENYQIKADNKVIKETLDSLVRYLESGK